MKKIEEKRMLKALMGALQRTMVADPETSEYLSKADYEQGRKEGREMGSPRRAKATIVKFPPKSTNNGGGNSK